MPETSEFQDQFEELRRVRDEALFHWTKAQEFHGQRKAIMKDLIAHGFSQADVARQLGVSRQAVQKMMSP